MKDITIEAGPTNATTDPTTGLRSYRWQGRAYPSVTSVRRIAGIPHGLVAWQLNQVVKRATGDLETLTSMLTREKRPREHEGRIVAKRMEEAGRWLRAAATEERDRSAKLGTAVHDAAASGKRPEEVDEEIRPRLQQYIDWLDVSGAEVLGSEFQCWSPSIGYAGSADLLVRFPRGDIHLVDLKTGSGIYAEYALQVMAYAMADFVGTNDVIDQQLTDHLHAHTGIAVLHLADDHWDYVVLKRDEETWAAFRGLLAFASWMANHPDADSITAAHRTNRTCPVCGLLLEGEATERKVLSGGLQTIHTHPGCIPGQAEGIAA